MSSPHIPAQQGNVNTLQLTEIPILEIELKVNGSPRLVKCKLVI
jgi:hypothetical protein